MEEKAIQIVARVAAAVHKKTRLAGLPPKDMIDSNDPRQNILGMLGATSGFFSAIVSSIDDMAEVEMISAESANRLRGNAITLATEVQRELQKQIVRDMNEAGAEIDEAEAFATINKTEAQEMTVDNSGPELKLVPKSKSLH